jgi:hypothetical protein
MGEKEMIHSVIIGHVVIQKSVKTKLKQSKKSLMSKSKTIQILNRRNRK